MKLSASKLDPLRHGSIKKIMEEEHHTVNQSVRKLIVEQPQPHPVC